MRTAFSHRRSLRLSGCRQRGIAAVELGLMLPLVMLLCFAVAEYGRYIHTYNTLLKASHAAARHLAMNDYLTAAAAREAVRTQALNLMLYGDMEAGTTPLVPGLTASMVTLCTFPTPCNPAVPDEDADLIEYASVRLTGYQYAPLFGSLWRMTWNMPNVISVMRGKK